MTTIDDAVARLRDAWDNAGRVPAYHHRAKAELHGAWPTLANAVTGLLAAADERARTIEGNMTLYSRDAADRLLLATRSAAETVKIDSAHLAQLAETIIALHDRPAEQPRIIRTLDELSVLDGDTVLVDVAHPWHEVRMSASEWMEDCANDAEGIFPLAVLATGEQVRAARQALEATE